MQYDRISPVNSTRLYGWLRIPDENSQRSEWNAAAVPVKTASTN
jgi:hypothetical protein